MTDLAVARAEPGDPPPPDLEPLASPWVAAGVDIALGLDLTIEVRVVRSRRKKCPVCGQRRVLYRLTAWAEGQAVGSSRARCALDAGFRA